MLVNNQILVRFRTTVKPSTLEECNKLLSYLDQLPVKVHAFINEHHSVVADFATVEDRESFEKNVPLILNYIQDDCA